MVVYPQHVYYENGVEADCYRNLKSFWKNQDIHMDIFESKVTDLEANSINGCKTCKSARKDIIDSYLNKALAASGKTAILTGYTLYDALAYLDEFSLLTNFTFNIDTLPTVQSKNRVLNCLHKMKIMEELPNNFRIIRPLIVFKEDEVVQYLKENNIPFINRPCIVASNKHKRSYFNTLTIMGKHNTATYEGILNFLNQHNVQFPTSFEDIEQENYFTDC